MAEGQIRTTTCESVESICGAFEESFTEIPLGRQIAQCDEFELVPLFKRWLPDNQPILEAGCGSGRWVAWFLRHGWQAVGLDWSEALCARASASIPGAWFEPGDMRAMPFRDGEFGAIVALGSIEHAPEGPEPALREFHRVLRPGGIAVITVPFNGPVREVVRCLRAPVRWAKALPWLRRMFRRSGWSGRKLNAVQKETIPEWAPVFRCNDGGWYFFEYRFTKAQMRAFMSGSGFRTIEEFVAFHDHGVLDTFGRIAGRFDHVKGNVELSTIGEVIRRSLPLHLVGHMLCYVVQRV